MTEYISREALEKWLLTEMASLDSEADRQCVIERLRKDIPAADVRPVRWISVAERLPEEDGQYICWFDHGGYMAFDTFRDGGWMTKAHIAAWMPLPKPPKEDKEETK